MNSDSKVLEPLTRIFVETTQGPKFGVVLVDRRDQPGSYCLVWVALDDLEIKHNDAPNIMLDDWIVKMPLGFSPDRVHIPHEKLAPPMPPQILRIRKRE